MAVQTYARVEGGRVVAIVQMDDPQPRDRFHPAEAIKYRMLRPSQIGVVQVGWLAGATGYAPPPPPPPPPPIYVPASLARERLEALGLWDEFSTVLESAGPAVWLKVTTLEQGIDPADPQARALISGAGADPDVILAPPGTPLPAQGAASFADGADSLAASGAVTD